MTDALDRQRYADYMRAVYREGARARWEGDRHCPYDATELPEHRQLWFAGWHGMDERLNRRSA